MSGAFLSVRRLDRLLEPKPNNDHEHASSMPQRGIVMRVDPSSREYSSPALRVMSAASVSESRAIARARAPMESVISLSHTPTISETWDRRPAQCARSFHGEAASSKAHALTDERWWVEGRKEGRRGEISSPSSLIDCLMSEKLRA